LNVKAKKRWQKWKKGCVISVFSLAMEHREGSWEKQAESAVQVRGAARGGYRGAPLKTTCRQNVIRISKFWNNLFRYYFEKYMKCLCSVRFYYENKHHIIVSRNFFQSYVF
jgi:hypothetical protein